MKKLKTLLTAVLALALALLPIAAPAEEAADLSAATPLIDLTAAAAIYNLDNPETITADGTLSEAFAYNIFLLGPQMDASLGITEAMQQDTAAQAAWLSAAYTAELPTLSGVLTMGETFPYIGVVPMVSTPSADGDSAVIVGNVYRAEGRIDTLSAEQAATVEWLDIRATVRVARSDTAPGGWAVTDFTTGGEIESEEETADYFNETMLEYVSGKLGMSVLYPADFVDCTPTETDSGMSVALADGSASFSISRGAIGNDDLATLTQALTAEGWTVNELETGDGLRADRTDDDGRTTVRCILLSDSTRYEATLTYDASLATEYSLYATWMVNSFTADELGIG